MNSRRTERTYNSFDFGNPNLIVEDVAYLYQSIYEGSKKIDQDEDGDNDFDDVKIARMIASGMTREEAIKELQSKRKNNKTQNINAEFELWVNSLLDEGYDLSDYTWDEIYDIYEETELERKKREEHKKNERRARVAELTAQGRVMTSSRRTSTRAKQRKEEQRQEDLEKAAQAALNSIRGATGRVSERPMGSVPPAPRPAAPGSDREDVRVLPTGLKKDNLGRAADRIIRSVQGGGKRKKPSLDDLLADIKKEGFEYNSNVEQLNELSIALKRRAADASVGKVKRAKDRFENERTSATAKYLMNKLSDARQQHNRLVAAAYPSPQRQRANKIKSQKASLERAYNTQDVQDSYELYNAVAEYLLDEGYVDDYESAEMMMENMSDEWLESILVEGVYK